MNGYGELRRTPSKQGVKLLLLFAAALAALAVALPAAPALADDSFVAATPSASDLGQQATDISGEVKSSDLVEGAEYNLTGPTTIILEGDFSLATIGGEADLTIKLSEEVADLEAATLTVQTGIVGGNVVIEPGVKVVMMTGEMKPLGSVIVNGNLVVTEGGLHVGGGVTVAKDSSLTVSAGGLACAGKLIVDGALTVPTFGVTSNGDIVVGENGEVSVPEGTAAGAILTQGAIVVNGGSVTASNTTDRSNGITAGSSIEINGGTVVANGVSAAVMCMNGDVTISGGSLEATASSNGVYCKNVTVSDGGILSSVANNSILVNGVLKNDNSEVYALGVNNGLRGDATSVVLDGGLTKITGKGNISYLQKATISLSEKTKVSEPLGLEFTKLLPASKVREANGDKEAVVEVRGYNTLSFDMNGHGQAIADQDGFYKLPLTEPDKPTAEDCVFEGWFKDKDCTEGNEFDFTQPITKDTVVYAKWAPFMFTLTFDMNGHGDQQQFKPVKVEPGPDAIVDEPEIDPEAEGWEFEGWFKDKDCTEGNEFDFTEPLTDSVTVFAKWTREICDIDFEMNGHGTQIADVEVNYGDKLAEPATPKADGWEFGGWYEDEELTEPYDFALTVTESFTLYAKWTKAAASDPDPGKADDPGKEVPGGDKTETPANGDKPKTTTYTVTFVSNGGSEVASQTVKSGAKATEPAAPTYVNHTFAGWFTDKDLTKAYSFAAAVKADTTLYAKWTQNAAQKAQENVDVAVAEAIKTYRDADPPGSKFSPLKLRAKKTKNKNITLGWNKVSKATKYVLIGTRCGKKNVFKEIGTFGKKKTSFTAKGLAKGKYHKFILMAFNAKGEKIATSTVAHAATTGGKLTNPKKVLLKVKKTQAAPKKSISCALEVGKSAGLKAKIVKALPKKTLKQHRTIRFQSSKPKVVKVDLKTGKMTALKKGKAVIFAYSQSGLFAKCKVSVS